MKKLILLLLLMPFFSFKKYNNNVDLFFGDSITFGNELYSLQYTARWPKQYTVAINTNEFNYARSGASMITNAWPGRPSFDINEVPAFDPAFKNIFISYWVNDYLYGKTATEFAAATATAVDGIIAKGWPAAKIVLCFNYLPESQGTWIDMTHAKASQWLAALRGVQQSKGTSFLDFYTAIYNRSDKGSYSPDLIHPTAAWNAIMKDMALTNIEGPSNTLPATLVNFSGQRSGNANQLKWTVAQEQNVQQYEIERSETGTVWTKAGSVTSQGTTNGQRLYSFSDNNISGSKQLYRLRTIDRNSSFKLSNVIIINGGKILSISVSGLFPNPTISNLNVVIDAPAKDNITIYISDAAGRLIKTQKEVVEAGTNTVDVNTTQVSPGSYMVKVVSEKTNETSLAKFVKK